MGLALIGRVWPAELQHANFFFIATSCEKRTTNMGRSVRDKEIVRRAALRRGLSYTGVGHHLVVFVASISGLLHN